MRRREGPFSFRQHQFAAAAAGQTIVVRLAPSGLAPQVPCRGARRPSTCGPALREPRRGESKRGKSELHRAVRRVTPGRGNSKESGTENTPLTGVAGLTAGSKQARVKRCGKSAPRAWQQAWQAKPRTEQGQIGERGRPATGDHRTARPRLPGRLLDPVSNDGARGMIVAAPKSGRSGREAARTDPGAGQNSAYGLLRRFFILEGTVADPRPLARFTSCGRTVALPCRSRPQVVAALRSRYC